MERKEELNPVLRAATAYVAGGLSVIPIKLDGSKQPAWDLLPTAVDPDRPDRWKATWNPFRDRLPTPEELHRWFATGASGMAVVCGPISGGVECIDIDWPEVVPEFRAAVESQFPGLADKLCWVLTPSKGGHIWYRCIEIEGNQKLALPTREECEEAKRPFKALVETRGDGGYAVVPGSPAAVHSTGIPYRWVAGVKLNRLVEITPEERDCLIRIGRSFHRQTGKPLPNPAVAGTGKSPADDFDQRGPSFEDLLRESGATLESGTWDRGKICRPGKERGWSATVGHCRGKSGEPLLHVFTSSWPPFEPEKTYGRFHVLRLLAFAGDGAKAMADCRRNGYGDPLPAGSKTSARVEVKEEEWGEPIPLEESVKPVPVFPFDALPKDLSDFTQSIGESVGCPGDFAAAFSLGMSAGAIGGSFAVGIKKGFIEPCCLFVAAIGSPGGGKSPSLRYIAHPAYVRQAEKIAEGDKDSVVFVENCTVEKMAEILQKNPRGITMPRDELKAFFGGFNQYKSGGQGNDRQHYLSIWSASPIKVDRKGKDAIPVFIAHPHLSILGGVQPEILVEMRTGPDDGLFDRFLFCSPIEQGVRRERWIEVDERLRARWSTALIRCWEFPQKTEVDGLRPKVMHLNESGKPVWEAWTKYLEALSLDDSSGYMDGQMSKIRPYAARLALVVHLLREVYGEIGENTKGIGEDSMARGVTLARYFLEASDHVNCQAGRDPRQKPAIAIAKWFRSKPTPYCFSRGDAWRCLRRNSMFKRPEDLSEPLKLLTIHGFIRWSFGKYEVNPKLSDTLS